MNSDLCAHAVTYLEELTFTNIERRCHSQISVVVVEHRHRDDAHACYDDLLEFTC